MIKYLKLFEIYDKSPNYSSYSKELNVDGFYELYKKNCKNFDWRNPVLYRGMMRTPGNIYYINSSKHEVRTENRCLYIFYEIIDKSKTWKKLGYPSKYRSIDFYLAGKFYNNNLYGDDYVVIPYDNSKLVLSKELTGNNLPNLTKVFNPRYYEEGQRRSDPNPYEFTSDIVKYYEKNIGEFDYSNITNNLNRLDDFLGNKKIDGIYSNTIKSIKMDKEKRGMSLVESLDFYFNPIDNEFKLAGVNDFNNIDKKYKVGWTNSEVLLVKKNIYKQLKGKMG